MNTSAKLIKLPTNIDNAKVMDAGFKSFSACWTIINVFENKTGLTLPEQLALDSAVEAVEMVVGELHDHSK